MKKKYYSILYFLLITKLSFSQTLRPPNDSVRTKFKFLYIVNFHEKETVATENAFIDPAEKDTTYGLPYNKNDVIYQLLKIDRIIFVKIKSRINLLTLIDIFNLYNVRCTFQKTTILINGEIINHPETIMMSKNQIDKLSVVKSNNRYYVHILMKGYSQIQKEEKKNEIRKI